MENATQSLHFEADKAVNLAPAQETHEDMVWWARITWIATTCVRGTALASSRLTVGEGRGFTRPELRPA